jgi:ABC-type antimicrobial peptide transport system permease subunit
VSSVYEIANLARVVTTVLQLLVGIVAGISSVVCGIGIMNIMLVSVKERTREIGIRMATDATPVNVLTQFLIEVLALSLAGGFLGLTLGPALALGLARLTGWPIVISPVAIALASGVSGAVGVRWGCCSATVPPGRHRASIQSRHYTRSDSPHRPHLPRNRLIGRFFAEIRSFLQ